MSDDIYSMTKAGFHEALRQAKEGAWDEGYSAGVREEQPGWTKNPYEAAK